MSRTNQERAANIQIHERKKTNLCHATFKYGRLVKVGRDFITLGCIDGKRAYFLEQRSAFGGEIEQSTTFFNIETLKKSIRK